MTMDFVRGIEIFNKAKSEINEKKLFDRWLIGGWEKEYSFDEFKDMITTQTSTETDMTEDEILNKVEKILEGGMKWSYSS